MNFTNSSQKKSWIFSQESLNACKARAVTGSFSSRGRVQKFASGFHQARENDSSSPLPTTMTKTSSAPPTIPFTPIRSLTPEVRTGVLSVRDQETLVQFHAHQIQTLVGPYALLKELRRSQKVLSTAIVLFRRFFLSNSVAEFNPRKMATAAAFLAAKLEEERVELSLLAHATSLVQRRVRHAPLCRTELGSISMAQIEQGERELMEGVNFEFICHHPDDLVEDLLSDVIDFMGEQQRQALQYGSSVRETESTTTSCESPRSVEEVPRHHHSASGTTTGTSSNGYLGRPEDMMENVMDAVNQTLIFSDAPFLFSPKAIAYAVCCIETQSFHKKQDGCQCNEYHMGDAMHSYLVTRRPGQTDEETLLFSEQVGKVITCLLNCPDLDLLPGKPRASNVIAQRAEDLRRVMVQVADLRLLYKMNQVTTSHGRTGGGSRQGPRYYRRKRLRSSGGGSGIISSQQYGYTPAFGPPSAIAAARHQQHVARKMARITPTNQNTGIRY